MKLSNLKETLALREQQQFNTQEELAGMQQLLQVKEESFRQQLLIENEKFEQIKVGPVLLRMIRFADLYAYYQTYPSTILLHAPL